MANDQRSRPLNINAILLALFAAMLAGIVASQVFRRADGGKHELERISETARPPSTFIANPTEDALKPHLGSSVTVEGIYSSAKEYDFIITSDYPIVVDGPTKGMPRQRQKVRVTGELMEYEFRSNDPDREDRYMIKVGTLKDIVVIIP
jgi:hypothetical protein